MIDQIKKFPRFEEFGHVSFCENEGRWTSTLGGLNWKVERSVFCTVGDHYALFEIPEGEGFAVNHYRAAFDAAVAKHDQDTFATTVIRED